MLPSPPAPGWYDDREGRRRWWDGQGWGAYAGQGNAVAPTGRVTPQQLVPLGMQPIWPQPTRPAVHQVQLRPAKDMAIAYLLLVFLGDFGAHRFYLGRPGSAIAMLVLTVVGLATTFVFVGFVLLLAVLVWWVVDLFLTAGFVREHNARVGVF